MNQVLKHWTGLLMVALLVVIATAVSVAAEPVTITLETYGLGDYRQGLIEEAVKGFEAENPDIKVNVVWDLAKNYWERLLSRYTAGDADLDVVINQVNWVSVGAESGMFVDLRPYMERDGFDRSLHWPGCIEQWEVSNGTYGLPWQCGGAVLTYNVSHLAEAGVSPPGDAFDYKDLIDVGKKLTKVDSNGETQRYGVGFTGWAAYRDVPFWLLGFGGKIFNEDGSKVLVNSPENVAALRYLSSLRNEYGIAEHVSLEDYINQKASIYFGANYQMGNLEGTDLNWKVGYLPKGPAGRFVPRLGNAYSVWGNSKHPYESWKLVEYFVTDGAKYFARFTLPTYQPAVMEIFPQQLAHRNVEAMIDQYSKDSVQPLPSTPDIGQIWSALSQETSAAFNAEYPPEEAVHNMDHRLSVILSERERLSQ